MPGVRIASAAHIGGAARLESTWLQAFGAGDRPLGWFEQKLVRERVDDELSQVAITEGADPRSPRSWLGFVLAGRLPSLGGAVRTAGTAVLPDARGRGVGRGLLQALLRAAAQPGESGQSDDSSVQIVADASAILYYERLGFRRVRDVVTLQLHACGEHSELRPPIAWDAALEGIPGAVELSAWTPEAWAGSVHRATVDLAAPLGRALVSREGTAWLVHRCLAQEGAPAHEVALALRPALPGPAPILMPHWPHAPVSSITGTDIVQRAALLSVPVGSALHAECSRR